MYIYMYTYNYIYIDLAVVIVQYLVLIMNWIHVGFLSKYLQYCTSKHECIIEQLRIGFSMCWAWVGGYESVTMC